MIRSLILSTIAIGSFAFAADKPAEKTTDKPTQKTAEQTTEQAKTPKREIASVSGGQLAGKAYELADLMVSSLGTESANCDLNIYQSQVIDQVSFAHAVDEKTPVPARVQTYLSHHLAYRTMMSQADWRSKPAELQKLLGGTSLYISAITPFLSGRIDLKADGTFVNNHGVWNDAKQDFDNVTVTGSWKVVAPSKTSDMKGLALAIHTNDKSAKGTTRVYRLGFAGNDIGFVKANHAKESQSYTSLDLSATDNGGCSE